MVKIKIVKIVDDSTIVINAGKKDNIKTGDSFRILDSDSEEVFDPETKESLGYLTQDKGIVVAKIVYDKMTVCETRTYTASIINTLDFTRNVRLDVDVDQISGGLETRPVSIGDLVEKI